MNSTITHTRNGFAFNGRVLSFYLIAAGLCVAAGIVFLLLNKPIQYAAMAVGLPIAVFVVVQPRLALFQFVFFLFIEYMVFAIPLYLIDFSAALVIIAAVIDILSGGRFPSRIPRFTWNLAYVIMAIIVCGLFSYWPQLAVIRILTFVFLTTTFLSLVRLSRWVPLSSMINWYFVLAVLHCIYVLAPFVMSGGTIRSFGLSNVLFDDISLVALPVGLSLYFGAKRGYSIYYLAGTAIVLGGLIATQSRLSIMFGLLAAAFVVFVAFRKARKGRDAFSRLVVVRSRVFIVAGIGMIAVASVAAGSLFTDVIARFEQLLNPDPRFSSALYRIYLWKKAIVAFVDHPIFGVGPGGYRHLYDLYPELRMSFFYHMLRTLGAHNAFLQYLATMGLVGGAGIIALTINKYRTAVRIWECVDQETFGPVLALFSWAFVFAVTIFIEAGWLWGQLSFLMVFFAAMIARQYARIESRDEAADSPPTSS